MADSKPVSIEQAVSLSGLRPLLLKALEGKLEGEEESIRKILYGAISGYSYEAQVQSIVNKELDRLLGEALRSAIGETFREYAQPLIRQRVADAIRSVIQEPPRAESLLLVESEFMMGPPPPEDDSLDAPDQASRRAGGGAGQGRNEVMLSEEQLAEIRERADTAQGLLDHHVRSPKYAQAYCGACWTSWPCDEANVRDSAADVPALLSDLDFYRKRVLDMAKVCREIANLATLAWESPSTVRECFQRIQALAREAIAEIQAEP